MIHVNIAHDPGVAIDYMPYPPGPDNGLLVLYGPQIAFADVEAPERRGEPRIDYASVGVVIPPDATEARAVEIFLENWRASRRMVGGSYDFPGVGNLSDRTAILYDIPASSRLAFQAWYELYYPGTKVVFA